LENERPTVLVVDDDPQIREALSSLLRSTGLQALTFSSAAEFLRAETPESACCLILDLQLPGISGLELQQKLAETHAPPIIFISGHGDIRMAVQAIKSGAIEFLSKPFDDRELLNAIDVAIAQDRRAKQKRANIAGLENSYEQLTAREREVLPLILAGLTNKQSAATLGIAEITLQVHRGQIMRKMGARSLPELLRMASKLGRL